MAKKITAKDIQQKMGELTEQSTALVAKNYDELVGKINEMGNLVDSLTSSSLKKLLHLAIGYPMIKFDLEQLTRLEKQGFDLLSAIKDLHMEMAFASVFVEKSEEVKEEVVSEDK